MLTAHAEKECAASTFRQGFGFHPLGSWLGHGTGGTGEPLAMMLRKGNAGSNTAVDHIAVTKDALAQLSFRQAGGRIRRKVLIRPEGGGTHEFLKSLTGQGRSYPVGGTLPDDMLTNIDLLPDAAWTPAYDIDRKVRDGVGRSADWNAQPSLVAGGHAGDHPREASPPG